MTVQENAVYGKVPYFIHVCREGKSERMSCRLITPKKKFDNFKTKMCIRDRLMKYYGVTEQLKAENQIEWVRQMNACVAQAEETIKGELIYCE